MIERVLRKGQIEHVWLEPLEQLLASTGLRSDQRRYATGGKNLVVALRERVDGGQTDALAGCARAESGQRTGSDVDQSQFLRGQLGETCQNGGVSNGRVKPFGKIRFRQIEPGVPEPRLGLQAPSACEPGPCEQMAVPEDTAGNGMQAPGQRIFSALTTPGRLAYFPRKNS